QAADPDPQVFPRATWFLERVYHNHSHWLTAHLPKLILLKQRDDLADILLPREPSRVMLESIAMLGIPAERFRTFDPARPVAVSELALVSTDRFGPSRVRSVRSAFAGEGNAPNRKVFISRANSRGRKLLNEETLWPMLEKRGFERVLMERLSFREQVAMMRETRVLLAPHGAGLTNMIFMPEGGHVIEMADPGFPNPNFYALACALGLDYWLIDVEATDADHPLDRDLFADPDEVMDVLDRA
ncbi:MAG: glycosyltransferase family 61 protein, partial [Erythrobacter sp.]